MFSPPSPSSPTIVLTPRPWALEAGKLTIIPLIAPKVENNFSKLPIEIWVHIFELAFLPAHPSANETAWRKSLLTVCKSFKRIVETLFYAYPPLNSVDNFIHLIQYLHQRDKQPISLSRIPYAAPGRWIQILDLSHIKITSPADKIPIDRALGMVFSYTPLLTTLILDPSCRLSKMTIEALAHAPCVNSLTTITGLSPPLAYVICRDVSQLTEDPITNLLSRSSSLEMLGLAYLPDEGDGEDYAFQSPLSPVLWASAPILHLPKLKRLSIKGLFSSAPILSLANSPLPSLQSLTITCHDHLPASTIFVPLLMKTHRDSIASLRFTPPPAYMHQSRPSTPDTVLLQFPNLTFLSLSTPCALLPPPLSIHHPLRCLAIPKPVSWLVPEIEKLHHVLTNLKVIMFHSQQWLPNSVIARARESGVHGEMLAWKRRFNAKGIAVLDSAGKTAAP